MSVHKLLHWSDDLEGKDGKKFCNVHLLQGYTPQTIPAYMKLIEEMQKTFPFVKVEEVNLGKVTHSAWCKGFTIIAWNGYLEQKEYEGWHATKPNTMTADYGW